MLIYWKRNFEPGIARIDFQRARLVKMINKFFKVSYNDFLRKFQKFYDDFKKDRPAAVTDMLIFLQEWIPHHITVEDAQYVRSLKITA